MKSIEEKIGYHFKDKKLLETALTHSSYAREKNSAEYNERMEFLGDAMLDAIAGEELYRMFPGREEGFLSRTRASLVCEKFLFEVAMQRGIGEHLRLSAGEEKSGGRSRPSILSDAVEALIGAVFLDGGYEAARDVFSHLPFHTRINYAGKCAAERVLRYHCPIGIITRKMEIFTKTRKIVHGNPAVLNL